VEIISKTFFFVQTNRPNGLGGEDDTGNGSSSRGLCENHGDNRWKVQICLMKMAKK
jgi:hypothetical protein